MSKAIVLYMPAVHAGYLEFIKTPGVKDVYLIDTGLAKELIPRLERDIRSLKAKETVSLLSGLVKNRNFMVLSNANINDISGAYDTIVTPNEDISVEIVNKYFSNLNVIYKDIFLRWDMTNSIKDIKPKHDYEVSKNEALKKLMKIAESNSKLSADWWRQVGSVIVKDGKVLMQTYNQAYPSKDYSNEIFGDPRSNFDAGENIELSKFIHAEAYLVSLAAKKGLSLEGSSIYVTTFPCPVCSKLIANAGIAEVYFKNGYSLLDAEDIFKAKNIKIIKVA